MAEYRLIDRYRNACDKYLKINFDGFTNNSFSFASFFLKNNYENMKNINSVPPPPPFLNTFLTEKYVYLRNQTWF